VLCRLAPWARGHSSGSEDGGAASGADDIDRLLGLSAAEVGSKIGAGDMRCDLTVVWFSWEVYEGCAEWRVKCMLVQEGVALLAWA